jgi:V-type H+-transporting ATPase subunit a
LSSLAGIINRGEAQRMKRIIFRASRGNALVHTIPVEKSIREYSGDETLKDVYIITFQEGETLRAKLTRVWESFNTDSFQLPTGGYHEKLQDVQNKIKETKKLISTTTNEMKLYLSKVWKLDDRILAALGVSRLSLYKILAEYDRAIYTNLNKFVSK